MKNPAVLSALLLVTGCATSRPCIGALPTVTVDRDVTRTPYRLETTEAQCLQAYEWKGTAPPRGIVVVAHGLRDHAVRYDALANAFVKQGFVVYGQDMRGHGLSGGARQRFDTMDELVAHLGLEVDEAKQRNPGVPLFLFGHSLGGLVSTTYAVKHGEKLAGLVLSAPLLKLLAGVSDVDKAGARFFSGVLPGLKVQALDDTEFVREATAKTELANDALIDHSNLPARSAAAALDAIDSIQAHLADVKVPLLVMHGTLDKATNIEGSVELSEKASSTDKTLKKWDGTFHDLLHEPERQQVIDLVTSWVVARIPAK